MSEEKKYTKTEEICEEIKNLTEEDLDNVTGGSAARVPTPTGSTTILVESVEGFKIEAAN